MSTLIVAAIGIALGAFVARFGEQLFDLALVKAKQLTRARSGSFSRHFRGIRPTGTDIMVFTVTARSRLPVTDVLYLRFLAWMLRERLADRLVLVVWFHAPPDADKNNWQPYWSFVHHCFDAFGDRVEIIDCAASPVLERPVSPLFWSALEHLTSPEYYRWVRHLGVPARALKHMNQARPGDIVLRGLVAHTLQNAHTGPTVVEKMMKRAGSSEGDLVLSVLIWELEVDRLAVYYELYDRYKEEFGRSAFTLNPVRGVTIRARRGEAGDNHTEESAISLVESPFDQLQRISEKSRRELRGYVAAMNTVLMETYDVTVPVEQWAQHGRQLLSEWRSAERPRKIPKVSRSGYALIFALNELRRQWRPGQSPVILAVESARDDG
jgi:hypothetical protein